MNRDAVMEQGGMTLTNAYHRIADRLDNLRLLMLPRAMEQAREAADAAHDKYFCPHAAEKAINKSLVVVRLAKGIKPNTAARYQTIAQSLHDDILNRYQLVFP